MVIEVKMKERSFGALRTSANLDELWNSRPHEMRMSAKV